MTATPYVVRSDGTLEIPLVHTVHTATLPRLPVTNALAPLVPVHITWWVAPCVTVHLSPW